MQQKRPPSHGKGRKNQGSGTRSHRNVVNFQSSHDEPSIKQITQRLKTLFKPWEEQESVFVLPTMSELVRRLSCSQVHILNSLLHLKLEGYRYVFSGINEPIYILQSDNVLRLTPPNNSGDEPRAVLLN